MCLTPSVLLPLMRRVPSCQVVSAGLGHMLGWLVDSAFDGPSCPSGLGMLLAPGDLLSVLPVGGLGFWPGHACPCPGNLLPAPSIDGLGGKPESLHRASSTGGQACHVAGGFLNGTSPTKPKCLLCASSHEFLHVQLTLESYLFLRWAKTWLECPLMPSIHLDRALS